MTTNEPVIVDCDQCEVRSAAACGDCVVSVLLGGPPQGQQFDADEQEAIEALAQSGLVPPLRLVVPLPDPMMRHEDESFTTPCRGAV